MVVESSSTACFCHCTPLCDCQRSCCRPFLPPIVNPCPHAVLSPATARPLLLWSLVGCCVIVRCWLLSLHAIVRLSTLSLLAAFDANHRPLPSGGLDTRCHLPFTATVIGWLLRCCLPLPPTFVIASCDCQRSRHRPLLPPIVDRCPQTILSPATACLCCSRHWLVVAPSSTACFHHHLVIVHRRHRQTASP
jgi:hypothetical protein